MKKLVWAAVAVEFVEGLVYIGARFLGRGEDLARTINSIMVLLTLPAMLLFLFLEESQPGVVAAAARIRGVSWLCGLHQPRFP